MKTAARKIRTKAESKVSREPLFVPSDNLAAGSVINFFALGEYYNYLFIFVAGGKQSSGIFRQPFIFRLVKP